MAAIDSNLYIWSSRNPVYMAACGLIVRLARLVNKTGGCSGHIQLYRNVLCRKLFREIRFKVKTIVCVDNLFLNHDLR